MSIFDKAKQFVGDNPDKIRDGIEKAGDEFDKRTDGKYADKVDRVQEEATKRFGGEQADAPEADKGQPGA